MDKSHHESDQFQPAFPMTFRIYAGESPMCQA